MLNIGIRKIGFQNTSNFVNQHQMANELKGKHVSHYSVSDKRMHKSLIEYNYWYIRSNV